MNETNADNRLAYLWGKTGEGARGGAENLNVGAVPALDFHPLLWHLLEVAACVKAIMAREPAATRNTLAVDFGQNDYATVEPLLLLLAACHDFGKAAPGFQQKWKECVEPLSQKGFNDFDNDQSYHGAITYATLTKILGAAKIPFAEALAQAAGSHHGQFINGGECADAERAPWHKEREEIYTQLAALFGFTPDIFLSVKELPSRAFMLIAGLISFADWIGSNTDFFPFMPVGELRDLEKCWQISCDKAEQAMGKIAWHHKIPLFAGEKSFVEVFPEITKPRELQTKIAEMVEHWDSSNKKPPVILIEAPMGEGKTEAAFYAFSGLQQKYGHRGLYLAMPTRATGNAMFLRLKEFLQRGVKRDDGAETTIDLQLLHGAVMLNENFQKIKVRGLSEETNEAGVRAAEWFTHRKRGLLSEYAVGTVDQALLGILPVKHHPVRLWGLTNRVVIFDEIHSYDTYTGELLLKLIAWLQDLHSSVILLSATVAPQFRRALAEKLGGAENFTDSASYPRISVYDGASCRQETFAADAARRQTIELNYLGVEVADLLTTMKSEMPNAGYALIIVNTVGRAQEVYQAFAAGEKIADGKIANDRGEPLDQALVGKRLADGAEIYLFHARYPAHLRQRREDYLLKIFGKDGARSGRKILIATQVVEQSLDLDFDLMISDLAPIDLILQRAGRLWRHQRAERPLKKPKLFIAGTDANEPPKFGKPLYWDAVYEEALLLRTFELLKTKTAFTLPDDLDAMVKTVYDENYQLPSDLPEALRKRWEEAEVEMLGANMANNQVAKMTAIKSPEKYGNIKRKGITLYDDDDDCYSGNLIAKTRLGELTITIIPIFTDEDAAEIKNFDDAKKFAVRAIAVTRRNIIDKLRALGAPKAWKDSPLLRNMYPLYLDDNHFWKNDKSIELNEDLGLVYHSVQTTNKDS